MSPLLRLDRGHVAGQQLASEQIGDYLANIRVGRAPYMGGRRERAASKGMVNMRQSFTYVRVVALIIQDGAVLLTPPWETQRSAQRLWTAPGGALEPGESIEAALVREVQEEIGAEIEPLGIAFVTQEPRRDALRRETDIREPLMSLEICCYAHLVSEKADFRPEHPWIPRPQWIPIQQVATLPTLPFSLRGWAKWVTPLGELPDGAPIVPVHRGVDADVQLASFDREWGIGSGAGIH